jgi:hypothetical protein
MDNVDGKIRGVSTSEAIRILHENGLEVTSEQAKQVLDFLYLFAVFSIKQAKQKNDNENS